MDWLHLVRLVGLGALASVGLSLLLHYLLFFGDDINPIRRSLAAAVMLPLLLTTPLLAMIAVKLQEVRRLRQELNHLAGFDRVTSCVIGTAFSSLVEGSLAVDRRRPVDGSHGALLLVDVEQLTAINARFGHNWGDEALRLVASVIRSSVRSGDVVGRVGNGQFGVFLPGASEQNAVEIGERIRVAVANAYFAPQGIKDALQVTVGGIVYRDQVAYGEMFQAAEQQLFKAKDVTPGRVELSSLPPPAHAQTSSQAN